MKRLKEKFGKNGLSYTMIKRNELVALYGVKGIYTNDYTHYEVCVIHHRDDKYGQREAIASNEQFGKDGSQCINDFETAQKFLGVLSKNLKGQEKAIVP